MFSAEVFQRFLDDAPFSVLFRATLEHFFAERFLDDLFERTARVQHNHRELLFSHVVTLLIPVVLRVRKSVRASYLARRDIPVTLSDVYTKLQGVEPCVCEALVEQVALKAQALLGAWPKALRPDPVPGLRLRTVDGNYLAGTEHRPLPLRDSGAAALPGMSVVLRDDRSGLLSRLRCREDGHTNERALLDGVLDWVEADDLLLADRAYCTLDFLSGLRARRAFYLIRQHKQLHYQELTPRQYQGRTATGQVYEQRVRLGADGRGPEGRCILLELDRPTRDGEAVVVLLSSVPAEKANALALADLYLRRWRLEGSFQELTQVLRCEVNTLAYPKAALLGFSLAVVAYNLLAVVYAALAAEHGQKVIEEGLSAERVAEEVETVAEGMAIALPAQAWAWFRQCSAAEMASWLAEKARGIDWRGRYQKSKRGPRKPPQVKRGQRGGHRSTARVLQNRYQT
jgi:hypothetical protein